jgi:AraC-like DNA-binding protein
VTAPAWLSSRIWPCPCSCRSSKDPFGERHSPRQAVSRFFLPASRSGLFNPPQRRSSRCSGIEIYIPPYCRNSERPHPGSNFCKIPCSARLSRPWPRRSKAALRIGSWSKTWARLYVSALLGVLSGISCCRPAGVFRRSGWSACATTSRSISTTIPRSRCWQTSPVSAPITSAAPSSRRPRLGRSAMQRRLERAKTLLRRTRQPLALIAQEVGFADQSHLTTIFRREMNVTPGQFRAALT